MNDVTPTRVLELDGAFNVRDVGGYPTRDGKITRWRRLLRADSLHRLTPEAQHTLLAEGLRTVIDLRRPSEVAREPNVLTGQPGVTYANLPVLVHEDERVEVASETPADLYRFMLDEAHVPIRAAMQALADAQAPALVHCYVGKDRTGVVIALALGTAGVPDEVIVEDYAISGQRLVPLMAEIRARLLALGLDVERFDRLSTAPPEAMAQALEHIRQHYGDVEGYLERIGVTAEQVQKLRGLLLD
jgi:protein-tyrosine phosphatase